MCLWLCPIIYLLVVSYWICKLVIITTYSKWWSAIFLLPRGGPWVIRMSVPSGILFHISCIGSPRVFMKPHSQNSGVLEKDHQDKYWAGLFKSQLMLTQDWKVTEVFSYKNVFYCLRFVKFELIQVQNWRSKQYL